MHRSSGGRNVAGRDRSVPDRSGRNQSEIDRFLGAAERRAPSASGRGRLIFALDATMSRQPTWDLAQSLQGKMFATAAAHGGLDVQLVYYRGFGECKASKFLHGGKELAALMAKISVAAGRTQIAKVLRHALSEARAAPVGALVFVGDAVEEQIDELADLAGEAGLLGIKAFVFQEGRDGAVEQAFRQIASLTGGAYAKFDAGAAERLKALLSAAAAYAAGGRAALEREALTSGESARLLLAQIR